MISQKAVPCLPLCESRKSPRLLGSNGPRHHRFHLGNGDAGDREQPADNQLRGHRLAKETTLERTANTGSSRPNGAMRPIEQWAISQNQRPKPKMPPMKIV